MQTHFATTPRSASPPRAAKPTARKNAVVAPLVIVPAIAKPHPVYGTTPIGRDGCSLEQQPIQTLNLWHERATAASADYRKLHDDIADDDAAYNLLYDCRWDIFAAAFLTKATGVTGVDHLLRIVLRHIEHNSGTDDETSMSVDQVKRLAAMVCKAAEPAKPTKNVGALQRGRKLTRAGLLHRYHSFLIQELETLSWNLYGHRDLALQYRPIDRAVTARCSAQFVGGKYKAGRTHHPFFDESRLTTRARSVLKSLKIDTDRNDDVPVRK
jgi:hypothetical protein